jgi:FixJ family two-component response regulator
MASPTVHIVDDDPSIRRALSRLLRANGLESQTYPTAKDFIFNSLPSGPACVVIDLRLPGMDGLELQQFLSSGHENLSVIFISGRGSISATVRAMKAGAVDFLTKPFDDHQFLSTISAALARSKQICKTREMLDRDVEALGTLSQREQQVCLRVVRGMLNKQIGAEFGTAEKTIKVQRSCVMKKLGARSLTDVVRLVERLRTAGRLPSGNGRQSSNRTGLDQGPIALSQKASYSRARSE